jgi:hypothetical protein
MSEMWNIARESGVIVWGAVAALILVPWWRRVTQEGDGTGKAGPIIVGAMVGYVRFSMYKNEERNREVVPTYQVPIYPSVDDGGWTDPGYDLPPGGGFQPGYENPAPGDDGSYDCAPGQAPVQVAPGDPYNLDADGDGVGCE